MELTVEQIADLAKRDSDTRFKYLKAIGDTPKPVLDKNVQQALIRASRQLRSSAIPKLRNLEKFTQDEIGQAMDVIAADPGLDEALKQKYINQLERYNDQLDAYKAGAYKGNVSIRDLQKQVKEAEDAKAFIKDWEAKYGEDYNKYRNLNSELEAAKTELKELKIADDEALKVFNKNVPDNLAKYRKFIIDKSNEESELLNELSKYLKRDVIKNIESGKFKLDDLVEGMKEEVTFKPLAGKEYTVDGIKKNLLASDAFYASPDADKLRVKLYEKLKSYRDAKDTVKAYTDILKKNSIDPFVANPRIKELTSKIKDLEKEVSSYTKDFEIVGSNKEYKLLEPKIGQLTEYTEAKKKIDNLDKLKKRLANKQAEVAVLGKESRSAAEKLEKYIGKNGSSTLSQINSPLSRISPKIAEAVEITADAANSSGAPLRTATSNVIGRKAVGTAAKVGTAATLAGLAGVGGLASVLHKTSKPASSFGPMKALGLGATLAGGTYIATKLLGNEGKRSNQKVRINPDRYYVVCEDDNMSKVVGSRLGYVNRDGAENMRESFINAGMYKDLRVNKGSTVIDKIGSVNFSHQYNFMNEETKEKLKTAGKVAATVGGLALAGLAGYNMYNAGSVGEGLSQTVGQLKGAAETAGKAIAKGVGYAAGKTVQGAKYAADKTVQGAKYAGNLAKRTGSYVARSASKAGNYMKNSFNETVGKTKILGGSPVAAIPLASKLGVGQMAKSNAGSVIHNAPFTSSAASAASHAVSGGQAAAEAAKAAATRAAAVNSYQTHFSDDQDVGYEKTTELTDKKIPTMTASVVGAGTGIIAWDKLKQQRLKRLKKMGETAHISDITKLNKNELNGLSGEALASLEQKGYEKLGKTGMKHSIGRGFAKVGRFGLGAGVTALAGLGAYKAADKIAAIADNVDKAKYVPNLDKIQSDKYYVIDKATDSHYRVMKSFDDYESANNYKIRHKGIGPRGNLYVNRGSTLLDKRV